MRMKSIPGRHEEEINKLWENSEADRKRFKEEYEEKLKEVQLCSA